MHRVIESHLEAFKSLFELDYKKTKIFEAFVNYVILKSYFPDNVQPQELIYEGDDPGIDGVLFLFDSNYIGSIDELKSTLKSSRQNWRVQIIFIQSTTSQSWEKKKINSFESALLDFLEAENSYPRSDFLQEKRKCLILL